MASKNSGYNPSTIAKWNLGSLFISLFQGQGILSMKIVFSKTQQEYYHSTMG